MLSDLLLLRDGAGGLHGPLEVSHGLEGEPHVEGDHGASVHAEYVQHPDALLRLPAGPCPDLLRHHGLTYFFITVESLV